MYHSLRLQVPQTLHVAASAQTARIRCTHPEWICKDASEGLPPAWSLNSVFKNLVTLHSAPGACKVQKDAWTTCAFMTFKCRKTFICRYWIHVSLFYFLFKLLTNHYERCWKYYCLPNGWANFGVSSEEELHLSRKLFWGIFESLAHKVRHSNIFIGFMCRLFHTNPNLCSCASFSWNHSLQKGLKGSRCVKVSVRRRVQNHFQIINRWKTARRWNIFSKYYRERSCRELQEFLSSAGHGRHLENVSCIFCFSGPRVRIAGHNWFLPKRTSRTVLKSQTWWQRCAVGLLF